MNALFWLLAVPALSLLMTAWWTLARMMLSSDPVYTPPAGEVRVAFAVSMVLALACAAGAQ